MLGTGDEATDSAGLPRSDLSECADASGAAIGASLDGVGDVRRTGVSLDEGTSTELLFNTEANADVLCSSGREAGTGRGCSTGRGWRTASSASRRFLLSVSSSHFHCSRWVRP